MDHRLTDQLMLLRLLDGLSRQQPRAPKISLICAGRYPGIENFIGLGETNPDQLASLADTRRPVFDAQFQAAQASWRAFTSSDPTEIERLVKSDISALPFLEKAILSEWPLAHRAPGACRSIHQNGPIPP